MGCRSPAEPIEAIVFFLAGISINTSGDPLQTVLPNSLIKSIGSLFACSASQRTVARVTLCFIRQSSFIVFRRDKINSLKWLASLTQFCLCPRVQPHKRPCRSGCLLLTKGTTHPQHSSSFCWRRPSQKHADDNCISCCTCNNLIV